MEVGERRRPRRAPDRNDLDDDRRGLNSGVGAGLEQRRVELGAIEHGPSLADASTVAILEGDAMRIYLAGPLFSQAERDWLDHIAGRLRGLELDPFVPHEHFDALGELTPDEVYRVDGDGLRSSNALLAWLDGPVIDDGTAAEIGAFAELVRGGDPHYRGIVGLVTDLRLQRRRGNTTGDGMNLFVAGAIRSAGSICWTVDEAIAALQALPDRNPSGFLADSSSSAGIPSGGNGETG